MERRLFLKNTLIGTSAVVLAPAAFLASCKPEPVTGCADWQFGVVNGIDVLNPDFVLETPLPILETRSAIGAILKAEKLNINLIGINNTPCYGFNSDNIWGPTLKLAVGETLSVSYTNNLDTESNIQWHGLSAPADNDGNPLNVVSVGETTNYAFTVNNRAGLYWYHAHVHGIAGKQLHLGLGGLVWVTGGDEIGLGLPSGERDIHLVIADKRFNEDDTLTYSPNISEKLSGYHGDKTMINGALGPIHSAKTRIYRLRFVNASNARIYNLGMTAGDVTIPFTIIGGDGGLLETALSAEAMLIAPGERIDVLVDFSDLSVGDEVILRSSAFMNGGVEGAGGFDLMKFTIDGNEAEPFVLNPSLSSIVDPVTTGSRTLNISNGNINNSQLCDDSEHIHDISGEPFDASIVNFTVDPGSAEQWVFNNEDGKEPRAMHIQGAQFTVESRLNGRGTVKQWEKGWKDTILCLPGEIVTVNVQFSNNPGKYVVYATNLENADTGLMNVFEIA